MKKWLAIALLGLSVTTASAISVGYVYDTYYIITDRSCSYLKKHFVSDPRQRVSECSRISQSVVKVVVETRLVSP